MQNSIALAAALAGMIAGCAQGGTKPHVFQLDDEPAGDNCARGGVRVSTGPDRNENMVLDPDEVTMTRFVCDGVDETGPRELVAVSDEPAGASCAAPAAYGSTAAPTRTETARSTRPRSTRRNTFATRTPARAR